MSFFKRNQPSTINLREIKKPYRSYKATMYNPQNDDNEKPKNLKFDRKGNRIHYKSRDNYESSQGFKNFNEVAGKGKTDLRYKIGFEKPNQRPRNFGQNH